MFGANFGAALGDVAHTKTVFLLGSALSIAQGIQGMHIKFSDSNEETRAREGLLILLVVADYMASILAEEALNALTELLAPFNIDLFHTRLAGFQIRWWRISRNFHRFFVIEGDICNEISNDWECSKWGHGDCLALFKHIHSGHTRKARLTVDFHRTGTAFTSLAIPTNC